MNTEIVCTPGGDAFEVQNQATSGNTHPASWFLDWATGGHQSDAGVTVNGYTALTHCPLWQGVNIIAGDIGQTPIRLLRNEFTEQRSHPAWNLLRVRPNELQTPSVFMETLMQWALVWGNALAWVIRRGGKPVDLIPLRPDCVWPELVAFDDRQILIYHYISAATGRYYHFLPWEVIHIQGLTGDGIWGYPLHEIAKNTIGHGLALEKHGNRSFSNGARPSGVLEHPNKLDEEARANLRREWESIHGGANNSGRTAILWEGMKFNAVSMSNIDAQWAEGKKLGRIDSAGLLNLPPHKLGSMEDSSVRSNLEEQNEVYKQMTLTRWSNRFDEEFRRKLLTDVEWKSDTFEFYFDFDAFLRGDIDTLTTVGDRCVKAEIMNRNEARRMIRLKPYPGGEKFGSPAINPREKPAPERQEEEPLEEDDDDDDEEQESPVTNRFQAHAAHRELLFDRVLHLLDRESHNLTRAATNVVNFVEWLDCFYLGAASVPAKIETLAASIMRPSVRAAAVAGLDPRGIQPAIAAYAKNRHSQLLAACSHVTKAELPAVIDKLAGAENGLIAQGLLATALGGSRWD